jgi:hypothetical protein
MSAGLLTFGLVGTLLFCANDTTVIVSDEAGNAVEGAQVYMIRANPPHMRVPDDRVRITKGDGTVHFGMLDPMYGTIKVIVQIGRRDAVKEISSMGIAFPAMVFVSLSPPRPR